MEKLSVINLVDLAGSEKAGQTGATGDRLKEGCAINKSLSVLGKVISTLADKAMGKAKNEVVPYRDAALTRILQTALGGNSKTIMICALSPSFMNYEETLSTLRYAERAKKIQNKAMINESVQDKIIRELKEENANLRKMIKMIAQQSKNGGVVDLKALGLSENLEEMMENMEENEKIIEDMQTPWEEKLQKEKEKDEQKKAAQGIKVDLDSDEEEEEQFGHLENEQRDVDEETKTAITPQEIELRQSMMGLSKTRKQNQKMTNDKSIPHLTNLHEDPLMSGVVYYSLLKGEINIGRKTGKPVPEIILGAIGIKPNHASIKLLKNGLFELTVCDAEAAAATMVNGKSLNPKKRTRVLNHCDRIAFNGAIIYVFKYPKLRKLIETKVLENAAKNEGIDIELQNAQAWELIQESGIEGVDSANPTKETLGVHHYSEEEVH